MPRDTPYAGVASIFCSALASGRPPQVFEDGGQTRDFIHVRDVARANVLALTAPVSASGTYNIASGVPRTVGDLAEGLAAAFGPAAARPVVTGAWRLGDVRHVVASPARAADRLGFVAQVHFEDGLAELYATLTGANELQSFRIDGPGLIPDRRWPTPRQPNSVAADPATGRVYVAGAADGDVQALQP